jgi:hypothetical protein
MLPFPWIDIRCDLRRNVTEKQEEYVAIRIKVIDLIEEFYLERRPLKCAENYNRKKDSRKGNIDTQTPY